MYRTLCRAPPHVDRWGPRGAWSPEDLNRESSGSRQEEVAAQGVSTGESQWFAGMGKAFEEELPSSVQETVAYLLGTVVNTVVGGGPANAEEMGPTHPQETHSRARGASRRAGRQSPGLPGSESGMFGGGGVSSREGQLAGACRQRLTCAREGLQRWSRVSEVLKDSFIQQLFVEHLFCAKQAFILGTVFLAESETDQPLPCGGALVFTG